MPYGSLYSPSLHKMNGHLEGHGPQRGGFGRAFSIGTFDPIYVGLSPLLRLARTHIWRSVCTRNNFYRRGTCTHHITHVDNDSMRSPADSEPVSSWLGWWLLYHPSFPIFNPIFPILLGGLLRTISVVFLEFWSWWHQIQRRLTTSPYVHPSEGMSFMLNFNRLLGF